jgi:hypothetical protein
MGVVIIIRKLLYNNYIQELNNKFINGLNSIKADYNFDYGDEFEIAICEILRSFLPIKYGICRGCIVASKGDSILGYQNIIRPNLMFGIALCQLSHALDYIRLGKIPWIDMLNEAKTSV